MKISPCHSLSKARRTQSGYVVMTLLAMLSVLLVFIMVNMRYLRDLDRELRLVERAQMHRLQKTAPKRTVSMSVTNAPGSESIAIIKQ